MVEETPANNKLAELLEASVVTEPSEVDEKATAKEEETQRAC